MQSTHLLLRKGLFAAAVALLSFFVLPQSAFAVAAASSTLTGVPDIITDSILPAASQMYNFDEEVIVEFEWSMMPDMVACIQLSIDNVYTEGTGCHDAIHTVGASGTTTSTYTTSLGSTETSTWNGPFADQSPGDHELGTQIVGQELCSWCAVPDNSGSPLCGSVTPCEVRKTYQLYPSIPYTVNPQPFPAMSVGDPSGAFVTVEGIEATPGSINVQNTGASPMELSISVENDPSGFWWVIPSGTVTVDPSTTLPVAIHFHPIGEQGNFTANLKFTCLNCEGGAQTQFRVVSGTSGAPAPSAVQVLSAATGLPLADLDFGAIPTDGPAATIDVLVKNIGQRNLSGDIMYVPSDSIFSCSPDCSYDGIVPGAQELFTLSFEPSPGDGGDQSRWVEFTNDAVDGLDQELYATAFAYDYPEMVIRDVSGGDVVIPPGDHTATGDYEWLIPGTFKVAQTPLVRTYSIRNVGAGKLDGLLSGLPSQGFTCVSGCSWNDLRATDLSVHLVTIQFDPDSGGDKQANITFEQTGEPSPRPANNASIRLVTENPVEGTPYLRAYVDNPKTATPIAETFDGDTYTFQSIIPVFTSNRLNYTIRNDGGNYLTGTVSGIQIATSTADVVGDFFCHDDLEGGCTSWYLAPGEEHTFVIIFRPQLSGSDFRSTSFTITNNEVPVQDITLFIEATVNQSVEAGGAENPPPPGGVLVGDYRTYGYLKISNTGGASTTIAIDEPPAPFRCLNVAECNFELGPGRDRDVRFVFDSWLPAGTKMATTTWYLNGAPQSILLLEDRSIVPELAVTPSTDAMDRLDFGDVTLGTTKRLSSRALLLDGVNDYGMAWDYSNLSGNTSGFFDIDGNFSIALWFRWDGRSGSDYAYILDRYAHLYLRVHSKTTDPDQGYLQYGFKKAGSYNIMTTEVPINQGEWYHVVIRNDGASESMYLDGISEIERTRSGPFNYETTDWYRNFHVGGDRKSDGSVRDNFKGGIDDIRFYNRPLDPAEISALATTFVETETAPAQDPSLTGYFSFDSGWGSNTGSKSAWLSFYNGMTVVEQAVLTVSNVGERNYGDLGIPNAINFTAGNDGAFTCMMNCSIPAMPDETANRWYTIVYEFDPGWVAGPHEGDAPLSYELVSSSTVAGGQTHYMKGFGDTKPLLQVKADYTMVVPPGSRVLTPGDSFVNVGASTSVFFTITNIGLGDLEGEIEGVDANSDWYCIPSCAYSGIASSSSTTIEVVFEPQGGEGTSTVDLRFTNVADAADDHELTLSARKNDQPRIAVTPATNSNDFYFGTAYIDSDGPDYIDFEVVITNTGVGTLNGSFTNDLAYLPFSCIDPTPCTYSIPGGASTTLTMRFEPGDDVQRYIRRNVVFTGGGDVEVEFSGTVYYQRQMIVNPTTYDFGALKGGETKVTGIAVENNGFGTLRGEVTTAEPFSCTSDCVYSLGSGMSVEPNIAFEPPLEQNYSDYVGFSGRTAPVLYYSFDRHDASPSDGYARDLSGFNRDATMTTDASLSAKGAGKFGGEYASFSDSTEFARSGVTNIAVNRAFTVSTFARSQTATWASPYLAGAWSDTTAFYMRGYNWGTDGAIYIYFRNADGFATARIHYLPPGFDITQWHQYMLTYEAGRLDLYIDVPDVPVATFEIPSSWNSVASGPWTEIYTGYGAIDIDEFLVYDRALRLDDRTLVMNEGDMVRVDVLGTRTFGSILNYSVEETDFGRVKVNGSRYHAFVFTNDGEGSVATGTVSVPQDYFRCVKTVLPGDYYDGCYEMPACDGTNAGSCCGDATCQFSMWPDSNVSVLIEFMPLERGRHSAAIEFSTLLNVSVPIQGTGYLPIEWQEGN